MQRIISRQVASAGRDLYTTEPKDVERFLRALKRDRLKLSEPIWEPAAGQGDISKTLMRYGHNVYSTDICPYKDGSIEIPPLDFFTGGNDFQCKTILTNPPFNKHEEFLLRALSLNVDVVFFVRLSFLASIRRLKIFKRYKPTYVYIYSGRAHCYKNGDRDKSQNMIDYCWMMWQYPYPRIDPSLRWIE